MKEILQKNVLVLFVKHGEDHVNVMTRMLNPVSHFGVHAVQGGEKRECFVQETLDPCTVVEVLVEGVVAGLDEVEACVDGSNVGTPILH